MYRLQMLSMMRSAQLKAAFSRCRQFYYSDCQIKRIAIGSAIVGSIISANEETNNADFSKFDMAVATAHGGAVGLAVGPILYMTMPIVGPSLVVAFSARKVILKSQDK